MKFAEKCVLEHQKRTIYKPKMSGTGLDFDVFHHFTYLLNTLCINRLSVIICHYIAMTSP